jgi:hypothetical protein
MTKNKISKKVAYTAAICLGFLSLASRPADASVIFIFEGVTAGTNPGTATFNYDLDFQSTTDPGTTLPTDKFMSGGSTYGTLYDIPAFVSASLGGSASSSFILTTQLVGITPAGTAPTDSTTLTNITLTYTGSTTTSSTAFPFALTVVSTASSTNLNGQYTGQDIKNAGAAAGSLAANIGFVAVPSAVPEPASLFSFATGAALLLVGGLRRRRTKQ